MRVQLVRRSMRVIPTRLGGIASLLAVAVLIIYCMAVCRVRMPRWLLQWHKPTGLTGLLLSAGDQHPRLHAVLQRHWPNDGVEQICHCGQHKQLCHGVGQRNWVAVDVRTVDRHGRGLQ